MLACFFLHYVHSAIFNNIALSFEALILFSFVFLESLKAIYQDDIAEI